MKNILLTAFFVLIIPAFVFAQPESKPPGTSAPIKWERYLVKDHDVSVLLPKMPTAETSTPGCSEVYTSSYYAYADGAVYALTIHFKGRIPAPNFCKDTVRFNRDLLLGRIAKLYGKDTASTEVINAGEDGHLSDFQGDGLSICIVPDMTKDRWIELSVQYRKGSRTEEKQFVESLEIKSDQGIHIKDGAEATIGDIDPTISDAPVPDPAGDKTGDPVNIIAKPRASYSELARRNGVRGTVALRVTLLKNGSVGNIAVIRSVDDSLAQQAIAAAKRIVFLPKRVNDVPVTVAKLIEYNFNIY